MMTLRRGVVAGWILVLRTRPAGQAVVSVPRSQAPARRPQHTGSGNLGKFPEGSGSSRSARTSRGRSRAAAAVAIGALGLGIMDIAHIGVTHAVLRAICRARRKSMEASAAGRASGSPDETRRSATAHPARGSRPPIASLVQLGFRVVLAGNEQRRQLEPDRGFVLEVFQRLQHRCEETARPRGKNVR